MFGIIKKMFIVLLTTILNTSNVGNASNDAKLFSLSYQKCEIQHTLINLHPNECSQELHYYPFTVKLDIRLGSCNTPNELSNKICVPNKTEDLNI